MEHSVANASDFTFFRDRTRNGETKAGEKMKAVVQVISPTTSSTAEKPLMSKIKYTDHLENIAFLIKIVSILNDFPLWSVISLNFSIAK